MKGSTFYWKHPHCGLIATWPLYIMQKHQYDSIKNRALYTSIILNREIRTEIILEWNKKT